MFRCPLRRWVASTVLLLKPFAEFTEGADSVRLIGTILVDRYARIRSAPSVGEGITAEFGGGCRKARLGVY